MRRERLVILLLCLAINACAPLGRYEETDRLAKQSALGLTAVQAELQKIYTSVGVVEFGLKQEGNERKEVDNSIEGRISEEAKAREKSADGARTEIAAIRNRLEGASAATISVISGDLPVTIYGNHSGHNSATTVTNRGPENGSSTSIRIVRVKRPSEPSAASAASSSPASDFTGTETTTWLSLSPIGSRREVVVPCGYQLEARSTKGAMIDIVMRYEAKGCR